MEKFSKKEAIKFGWETTKKNLGFFIIVLIIGGVISSIVDIIDFLNISLYSPIYILVALFSLFMSVIISMGLVKIPLLFCDGKKPIIKDLFSQHPLFFKFLGATILYGLAVFAGLLLFIVPGIIIGIKFWFYDYLVIDKKLSPAQALKKSAEITKGIKWELFLFSLLMILINVAGLLALGIGLFATIPTSMVATAFVYRKLISPENSLQENSVPVFSEEKQLG